MTSTIGQNVGLIVSHFNLSTGHGVSSCVTSTRHGVSSLLSFCSRSVIICLAVITGSASLFTKKTAMLPSAIKDSQEHTAKWVRTLV